MLRNLVLVRVIVAGIKNVMTKATQGGKVYFPGASISLFRIVPDNSDLCRCLTLYNHKDITQKRLKT